MNQIKLESILKKARLPEIPVESLEMFPRRVVARLKRHDASMRKSEKFFPRLAWAFGLAICVVVAIATAHWTGGNKMKFDSTNDALANVKVIRETLALFPNQVRAIVEDKHGIRLVLSDKGDVPSSSPLYVRICDGQHCASFVTFSGQEIQVAGQKITVLADARGGIILAGNKFIWSSTAGTESDNHLKIKALNLGPMAM
jgi:hypothetical protein